MELCVYSSELVRMITFLSWSVFMKDCFVFGLCFSMNVDDTSIVVEIIFNQNFLFFRKKSYMIIIYLQVFFSPAPELQGWISLVGPLSCMLVLAVRFYSLFPFVLGTFHFLLNKQLRTGVQLGIAVPFFLHYTLVNLRSMYNYLNYCAPTLFNL